MAHISDIIKELKAITKDSDAEQKQLQQIELLLKHHLFANAALFISKIVKKGVFKSAFQKTVQKLIPLITLNSQDDAEQRLKSLQAFIHYDDGGDGSLRAKKLKRALDSNLAVVADGIDGSDYCPLLEAIKLKDERCIEALIQAGATLEKVADINEAINADGDRALHIACAAKNPNLELIAMLLNKGADPNSYNDKHETPFQLACLKNNTSIALLLLNKGAKADLQFHNIDKIVDAFFIALENKNVQLAKAILAFGYDVSSVNLQQAKGIDEKLYRMMKVPFKVERKKIISGSTSALFKTDTASKHELAPLFERIYTEDGKQHQDVCEFLHRLYTSSDSTLKPLIEIMLIAAQGKHLGADNKEKKYKAIISAQDNIHSLTGAGENTRGYYNRKNTVYIAGAPARYNIAMASLLHESQHFVESIVLGPGNQPYKNINPEEFSKIKKLLAQKSKSFIKDIPEDAREEDIVIYKSIYDVFAHYPEEKQDREIMVKVPEVIGLLGLQKGTTWLKDNEPELLDFYKVHFTLACRDYVQDLAMGTDKQQKTFGQ